MFDLSFKNIVIVKYYIRAYRNERICTLRYMTKMVFHISFAHLYTKLEMRHFSIGSSVFFLLICSKFLKNIIYSKCVYINFLLVKYATILPPSSTPNTNTL